MEYALSIAADVVDDRAKASPKHIAGMISSCCNRKTLA
jgi:hypothetical protein